MRKIILILIFNVFFLNGQNTDLYQPRINNLPSSPETALLGRFGEIPVGYYTGTANIAIPLYTVKEGDMQIPIELKYHNSGIKVKDEATWVGLGWDLSPGGEIIQEIRGKEDEFDTNLHYISDPYHYNIFKANRGSLNPTSFSSSTQVGCQDTWTCSGNAAVCVDSNTSLEDSYTIIDDLLHGEGQPDIYHYRFGNYSGKFYIHPETKNIVLIDKKEAIIFEKLGAGWVAKTLLGDKFYFQIVEYTTGSIRTDFKGKTFKLSLIILQDGKTVHFEYVDEMLSQSFQVKHAVIRPNLYTNEPTTQGGGDISVTHKKTLSKIINSDVEVVFNLENREDMNIYPNDNIKRLKSIDIISKINSKKIKSFEFGYSYFPFNLIGVPLNGSNSSLPADPFYANHLDSFGKRLKLEQLKEIGYKDEIPDLSMAPYNFEYDLSVTMPLKCSFATDFWGYYNGKNNTDSMPDLDYFDYEHMYGIYYNEYSPPFSYNYTKNNRYTDNAFAGAYLLKKIVYPTGGFTEFTYEPNSFSNQFIPNDIQHNQAKKYYTIEDKNLVGDVTQKIFQLSKTTTVRFENKIYNGFIPGFPNFTPYTYNQMLGSSIQLLKVNMTGGSPQVTILKTWNLSTVTTASFEANNGVEWNEDIRIEYDSNPNVHYTLNVNLPAGLTNNTYGSVSVRSRIKYIDDTGVDKSVTNQCGMRIKSIKNFTNNNTIATTKTYNYSGGKLLHKFIPLEVTDVNYVKCTGEYSQPTMVSYAKRIIVKSDNYISSEGSPIGYNSVEEVFTDNSELNNIGKIKRYYFNQQNENTQKMPAVVNQRNGFLKNEEYYNTNNFKVKEIEYGYVYVNPQFSSYLGIIIDTHTYGPHSNSINGSMPIYKKYSFLGYSIIDEHLMISGKAIREFLDNGVIESSESYTYNTDGFLKSKTLINSQGDTITEGYEYATDYPIVYGALMAKNMKGIVVRTSKYKNGVKMETIRTNYDTFNLLLLPKSIESAKSNSDWETRLIYESYDSKGNLLQLKKMNGVSVSYIWGYNNSKPVAQLENIKYTDIPQTLIFDIQSATDSSTSSDQDVIGTLNALRTSTDVNLQKAMITTFTFKPSIGVSTITDPKGQITAYEYDSFGRLQRVRDALGNIGNILSENEYHYKPQN